MEHCQCKKAASQSGCPFSTLRAWDQCLLPSSLSVGPHQIADKRHLQRRPQLVIADDAHAPLPLPLLLPPWEDMPSFTKADSACSPVCTAASLARFAAPRDTPAARAAASTRQTPASAQQCAGRIGGGRPTRQPTRLGGGRAEWRRGRPGGTLPRQAGRASSGPTGHCCVSRNRP